MSNELIFFLLTIFVFASTLFAFRLGKRYLVGLLMIEAVLFNIFVVKQFDLFGLAVTGGNILYGASFLITDILNEHYGKRIANQAVWAGFGAGIFMLVTTQLTRAFTPNEFDFATESFTTLFSPTARIVLASLTSYLIVQLFDVWFFDWIKQKTNGRWLWLRNNLSTITSQAFDSLFFTAGGLLVIPAFASIPWLAGFVPAEAYLEVVLFTWIVKVVVALLDTPIIYLTYWLKPKRDLGEKLKELIE